MTRRASEMLGFYRRHRIQDQLEWFHARQEEYSVARRQLLYAVAAMFVLTSVLSILAGFETGKNQALWKGLAGIAPALAAAMGAYDQLVGFKARAQASRDGMQALEQLTNVPEPLDSAEPSDQAIREYVSQFEDTLWEVTKGWPR